MTNKVLSLMTLLCILGLEVLLMNFPSYFNPVESFISSDRAVAIARAFLIIGAVAVSFWPLLRNLQIKRGVTVLGFTLIIAGIGGLFLFNGFLYEYLKPLDMLLMAEVGVVYSMAALTSLPVSTPAKPKRAVPKTASAKKRSPQYILN